MRSDEPGYQRPGSQYLDRYQGYKINCKKTKRKRNIQWYSAEVCSPNNDKYWISERPAKHLVVADAKAKIDYLINAGAMMDKFLTMKLV